MDTNNKLDDDQLGLIVHSYNNHLASMMGYIELLLIQSDSDTSKEYLNNSLDSGHNAVHFGKQILASLGRLQVSFETCCLIHLIQPLELNSNLELDISSVNENITVSTCPKWFTECLVDLISFSLKVSTSGQIKVIVNHREGDDNCSIELIAGETNLSEEQQKLLFKPFYASRTMFGTKDIGLSKAKGFFEQMNSTLAWIQGKGFVINLPLCVESD